MKNGDGNESKEMQDRWKYLNEVGDIPLNLTSSKPLIRRFTPIIRNKKNIKNERYFTPTSVAVSPLHNDKKLQRSEEFKLQLAAKFIRYSGRKTEDFYKTSRRR
ncbi:hypothetical protein SLE2022_135150 [Rubroshorea leprosula]